MIGLVTLGVLLLIRFTKMPRNNDQTHNIDFVPTLKRIFAVPRYREGVLAQFFYVGAQIMCWTFIIQYGTRLFMETGMEEQAAEVLSQKYNIIAMAIFCTSRFHLYVPPALPQSGAPVAYVGRRGRGVGHRSDFLAGCVGHVLPGRHFGLYVAHVPDDLRYSPARVGG